MAALHFDENLVVFVEEASSPAEVEAQLAAVLEKQGYVKDSFVPALLAREQEYPTALEVGKHNVAIPHTDAEHTLKGAVCVGILEKPVTWQRMDDSDESCDVDFVVMLALNDPHDHLDMLQKVIALVQDQDLVGRIVAEKDHAAVAALVAPRLV